MAEDKFSKSLGQHRGDIDPSTQSAALFRSCGDKLAYPSKKIAKAGARRMIAKGYQHAGKFLNSYKCKGCGKWHNGHSRSPQEGSKP